MVINTLNNEKSLLRVIESVSWANEILICDMHSSDKTVEIAKKLGTRVFYHKRLEYVEPARNFAVSKTKNEWILVIDPDEEIPKELSNRLQELAEKSKTYDYVLIPRKNIIFGKWMKASGWWPDLNIRFFKKGQVKWTDKIHRPPQALGEKLELPAEEKWAIIHNHYENISQFLERMIRYTKIQALQLKSEGYIFDWRDLIKKPVSEFLTRFFAKSGFKDGLHGLALSLLQSFSFLVLYLRLWEMEKFKEQEINLFEFNQISEQSGKEFKYWLKFSTLSKNPFKRFFQKAKSRLE